MSNMVLKKARILHQDAIYICKRPLQYSGQQSLILIVAKAGNRACELGEVNAFAGFNFVWK